MASGGTNYISNVTYNAAHAPTAYSYGNGVAAAIGYNSRFQLASLAYTKSSTKLLELAYGYAGHSNGGNNGQITGITDSTGTAEAGRTVSYTYDGWARLKTAATTGSSTYPAWGLSWSDDRYGNRKQQTVTAGSGPSSSLTISTGNNRITDTGYSYDLAGNMTADGLNTLAYDGENRVATSTTNSVTTTNTYDGNSLRVKKQVGGGTATIYIFSGSKVIAEYAAGAGTGSPTREYIYGGSALVATIDSSSTKYHHADHLSARVTTDTGGTKIGDQGHYPLANLGTRLASAANSASHLTSEQQDRLPTVVAASVPFYPRTPQMAHIEGVVRLRVRTDGTQASSIQVEGGQPMLAEAAKENIKTWQFEQHSPTTFETTFRYRLLASKCDSECNCDTPEKGTVLLRLPAEVEVSAKELLICDPAEPQRRSSVQGLL